MAAITQSGYPVITSYGDPRIKKLVVSGVNIAPGVLKGDVYTILGWVAAKFNSTVSQLISGQCWGFAPKQVTGGYGWSNHAGATAIDLNSVRFPQGTRRMSRKQVRACRIIIKACKGVVRWGGDYTGSSLVDQMHFEIDDSMAYSTALKNLAIKIKNGGDDMASYKDKKEIADMVVNQLLGTRVKVTSYRNRADGKKLVTWSPTIKRLLAETYQVVSYTQGYTDKFYTYFHNIYNKVK